MAAAMSLDAMWKHLESLAALHAIKIDTARVRRPVDAFAIPAARTICVSPIRSAIGYATALHEMGHLLGTNQDGPEMDSERAAWQWARDNALVWTNVMEHCAQNSLAHIAAKRAAT